MEWREGTVDRELSRWPGAVEYAVHVAGGDDRPLRALAYPAVTGAPHVGDRVLLNVSAAVRGLGTGGVALVVAVPERLPPDPEHRRGHIVKARYTPQQQLFLAVDEQDSPHHAVLSGPAEEGDLGGMPVVVADLHSALPAILAGLRLERPELRVAYLMTDGGALPIAFSRTVAGLAESGWLHTTITVGQAYGGQYEAVTLHSGLVAARYALGADVAVVVQGPGNVGTDTRWGFSGIAAGEALTAATTLHGRGVASLRVSDSDTRQRHRGISHHSLTAYGRVALGAFDIPVAAGCNAFQKRIVTEARELVGAAAGHPRLALVEQDGIRDALDACPVTLSTMGRGLEVDPEPFVAAAVAGRFAARLVEVS